MATHEAARRALCTATAAAWVLVVGTIIHAITPAPTWFGIVIGAAVGFAWFFVFERLWPPRTDETED